MAMVMVMVMVMEMGMGIRLWFRLPPRWVVGFGVELMGFLGVF